MNKKNKKGFEMAISTLIILVLGVMVLIALAISFTGGWGKFWGMLVGYSMSDVDAVKKACDNSCVMQNNFDFCCRQREVNFGAGKQIINCTDSRLKVGCGISCSEVCGS